MQSERDWRRGYVGELQAPPLANTPCQRFKAACASYAGGSLRLLCAPVCVQGGLFKGMHYSGDGYVSVLVGRSLLKKTFFYSSAVRKFQFNHDEGWPRERYHSSYRLREDSCHDVMTDALRFVFLELGRFKKRIWELHTVFDKWMYLLKHMHELVSIPKEFSDPLFTRLFMLAEIHKFTPEEYELYQKSRENMSELDNVIASTAEVAEKRGRELGRAEGRAETVKKMLAAGISVEMIANALGMSVEEIGSL